MTPAKSTQTMKASTAAQKLGIYLPATPESFRENPVTRDEFNELNANPPEWLVELRKTGPHPRDVVAHKLGISNSGLARSGVSDVMTSEEILGLLKAPPEWLVRERAVHFDVTEENSRIKALHAYQRAQAEQN
jgi:hypothetical protein